MNRLTAIVLTLVLAGCSSLTHVVWPASVACSGLITGSIVSEIDHIIATGSASLTADLEAIAVTNGATLVVCVLQQLLASYNATPAARGEDPRAIRVRAFLAAHKGG